MGTWRFKWKIIWDFKLDIMFRVILIFIIINVFYINQSFCSENKILFKINKTSFTSFDITSRETYLQFIGDDKLKNTKQVFTFIAFQLTQ